MANFLPLIPPPFGPGEETLPAVLINAIEATPASYSRMMSVVDALNGRFMAGAFVAGRMERVRPIRNVMRFWQFTQTEVERALTEFLREGGIPPKSPTFNQLFFGQLSATHSFIIDDIFDKWLHIKRANDLFETWHDSPIEIDDELGAFDNKVNILLLHERDADVWRPEFAKLRAEIELWFTRENVMDRWNEFKEAVTVALKAEIDSHSIQEFLRIARADNSDPPRRAWLERYAAGEGLVCAWPTVYACAGVLHRGDPNPLLAAIDADVAAHAHRTLPDTRGQTLPRRTRG